MHLRDQARFAKAVGSLLRGGRLREEIRAKRGLTDPSALPNPWLLYLSQGTLSGLDYHEGGRATADYIRRQFADAGLRLTPDSRLFGLRMRRWADSAMVKDQAAKGCDCNPDFVAWCDANLPGVQTALNGASPPTTYPLDTFDALYAQSVLTHLTPPQQAALMTEWARIVRPDGLILATFLGRSHFLIQAELTELQRFGHVVRPGRKAGSNLCAVYNTADDVIGRVGAGFVPLFNCERGMPVSDQDVYVFRVAI